MVILLLTLKLHSIITDCHVLTISLALSLKHNTTVANKPGDYRHCVTQRWHKPSFGGRRWITVVHSIIIISKVIVLIITAC